MKADQRDINQMICSQPERDLLVALCRYSAQVLYAARNGLDSRAASLPQVKVPQSGVIPARTVLLDGAVKAYRHAAGTLRQCGFVTEQGHLSGRYILDVSSDQFALIAGPDFQLQRAAYPTDAFLDIFDIYEPNERLGHPDTLRRIFDLFLETGLTEERFGFIAWSQRALDLARPTGERLWATDAFAWYIEEAEAQWLDPQAS